jgi:hypothetical protein
MGKFGNIFTWVMTALDFGVDVYHKFHGTEKPNILNMTSFALTNLLPAVQAAVNTQNLTTEEQIDTWAQSIDAMTGTDVGAVSFDNDMPLDKQEELADHMIAIMKITAKHVKKIKGYVVEPQAGK